MSCLASFEADSAQSPVFFYDSRYRYHHDFDDEAAILVLPVRKATARAGYVQALQWLGQFCADRKNRGYLTKAEIGQCWAAKGITRSSTRTAWRRRLVESDALIEYSDGYQLKSYARFNLTPEQWAEKAKLRREYKTKWEANKRADVLSQDRELERLEFMVNFCDGSEQPFRCTSSGFPDSVDNHHIEQCASELPPPSLSPEGVAPPGPDPSPPLTFPKRVPPQGSDTPQGKCLPNQVTPIRSPLRARSRPIRVAPQSKTENRKAGGALGSADAYPNLKAGKAKAGESKTTPPTPRNEAEQWVHDIMARQNIPWVLSAKQGMAAE